MCGIVGYAAGPHGEPVDLEWAHKSVYHLKHRGPDGNGNWISEDNRIFIGHTLLSLVEEPSESAQPIHDSSGRYVLAFNGEIYNHKELRLLIERKAEIRWISGTDTESLLQALIHLGVNDTLRIARGMFAFSFYDKYRKITILARDRSGEKPLYYLKASNSIYYSSELKALLCNKRLPRRISTEALNYLLATGYSPTDLCILDGYSKVEPGSYINFDSKTGNYIEQKYWRIEDCISHPERGISLDQNSSYLEYILRESITEQLEARMEPAILLSGGLDSSILTAIASQMRPRIKTFSVLFNKFSQEDAIHSHLISQYFNTDHHDIICQPPTENDLRLIARQFDEPIIDSSVLACNQCFKEIKCHTNIAIGGDGADELFGGYPTYQRMLHYRKLREFLPPSIRRLMAEISGLMPRGVKGKKALQDLSPINDNVIDSSQNIFDIPSRIALGSYENRLLKAEDTMLRYDSNMRDDWLLTKLLIDYKSYLREDLIVKNERTSMLHSVELRLPYLDHRVVSAAFGRISSDQKVSYTNKKIILKEIGKRLLPESYNYNRKQGFSVPIKRWLKENDFEAVLFESSSGEKLFPQAGMKTLVNQAKMTSYGSEGIFGLIMIELWRQEYNCIF